MRSPAERSKPPAAYCATSARLCRCLGPCRTPSAWRSLSASISARLRRLSTPASGSQSGTPELSSRIPSQHLHARPEPTLGQRRFWLFPARLSVPLLLARGASQNLPSDPRWQRAGADFISTPRRLGHVRRHAGATGTPQEALQTPCQAPATASDFCAHAWQRPVAA
jgi:hypothetical protein